MQVTPGARTSRFLLVWIALAGVTLALAAPAHAGAQRAARPALDSITAGLNFTCGLAKDGRALCWGEHQSGQLGAGAVDGECAPAMGRTLSCARGPVEVAGKHHFVAIRAGSDHACAIDRDGDTWCWGVGYFSPLVAERESQICRVPRSDGLKGQVPCSKEPARMPRLAREMGVLPPRMRAVAGGAGMTCGADESGDVYCWSNYQIAPFRIVVGSPVTTVAAGGSAACALTTQGRVRCWEWDGFYPRRLTTVIPDTGFTAIAVGTAQACAIDASGTAHCWRRGESPTPVEAEASFTRIATSEQQSCAIADDGALWCWAHDHEPARMHPTLRFAEVTVGAAHACAVTTAHVTLCWGANASGQLGDGSHMPSAVPVRVRTEGVAPVRVMALDLYARVAGFVGRGGLALVVVLALAFVLRARVARWSLASFVALWLGALVLYTIAAVGAGVAEGGAARALELLRPQAVVLLLVLSTYVVARAGVRAWRSFISPAAALAGMPTAPAAYDPAAEERGRGQGFRVVMAGWALMAVAFVLVISDDGPHDHVTAAIGVFILFVAFCINVALSLVGGAMARHRLRRFADDGRARVAFNVATITVLLGLALAAFVAFTSAG